MFVTINVKVNREELNAIQNSIVNLDKFVALALGKKEFKDTVMPKTIKKITIKSKLQVLLMKINLRDTAEISMEVEMKEIPLVTDLLNKTINVLTPMVQLTNTMLKADPFGEIKTTFNELVSGLEDESHIVEETNEAGEVTVTDMLNTKFFCDKEIVIK